MKTEDFKVRLKVSTFFDLWVIIPFALIILSCSINPSLSPKNLTLSLAQEISTLK